MIPVVSLLAAVTIFLLFGVSPLVAGVGLLVVAGLLLLELFYQGQLLPEFGMAIADKLHGHIESAKQPKELPVTKKEVVPTIVDDQELQKDDQQKNVTGSAVQNEVSPEEPEVFGADMFSTSDKRPGWIFSLELELSVAIRVDRSLWGDLANDSVFVEQIRGEAEAMADFSDQLQVERDGEGFKVGVAS